MQGFRVKDLSLELKMTSLGFWGWVRVQVWLFFGCAVVGPGQKLASQE